jgi:hypothetical protein
MQHQQQLFSSENRLTFNVFILLFEEKPYTIRALVSCEEKKMHTTKRLF